MFKKSKNYISCLGFRLKLFIKLEMLPELINNNPKQNIHGRVYL